MGRPTRPKLCSNRWPSPRRVPEPLLPHQLLLLQPQSPPHHLRLTPQLWSVELDKWPTVHAHALASAAPLPSPTLQFKVSVLSAVSQVPCQCPHSRHKFSDS